jgi:hypothetical protein
MQAIIAIAVMAWNISLFPDEEHAHVQGMLLESLPTQLSGKTWEYYSVRLTP